MIIRESIRQVINENAETNNVKAAKNWLRANVPERYLSQYADGLRTNNRVPSSSRERFQEMNDIDVFIYACLNDVNASRQAKKKFLVAVCRMFWSREFTDPETLLNFNECVEYITSNGLEDEFDRDLNGMSVGEIIDEFLPRVHQAAEDDRNTLANMQFDKQDHQYQIVRLRDFSDARRFHTWAPEWCTCNSEYDFSNYSEQSDYDEEPNIDIYVLLRDDYKTVQKEIGPGCPLDDYGLSMLCVRVTKDGRLRGVTPRWNHENGGTDRIMNTKTLSKLLGDNFYDIF